MEGALIKQAEAPIEFYTPCENIMSPRTESVAFASGYANVTRKHLHLWPSHSVRHSQTHGKCGSATDLYDPSSA